MRKFSLFALALIGSLGLILSTNGNFANANSAIYTCKIKYFYSLNDEGALFSNPILADYYIGSEFIVSKYTGTILGERLNTSLAEETRIVDYGSDEWAFKAVYYFARGIKLIEIEEFISGKNKPFVAYMSVGDIITGICQ